MAQQPEPDFTMVIVPPEKGYTAGAARVITLTITNSGVVPLKQQRLSASGSGMWFGGIAVVPELLAGESINVTVEQQPLAGSLLRHLDFAITVSYEDEEFEFQESPFQIGRAVRSVGFPVHTRPLRVAILGPMGSGKTTMVNMLATMLHGPTGFRRPAASGNGVDTHTVKMLEYKFGDITICDAYGIDNSSWGPEHLGWYIDGTLPPGICIDEVHQLKPEDVRKLRRTMADRKKDAVIFCMSATLLGSIATNPQRILAVNAFAQVRHATPLLVLTQVDNFDASITAESFDAHEEIYQELRKKAAEVFSIEPRRVFPMMAYRNEKQRSHQLDRAAYRLLEASAELAGEAMVQEQQLAQHGNTTRLWQDLLADQAAAAAAAAATGAKKK